MVWHALQGCLAAAALAAGGDTSATGALGVLAVAPPPGPDDALVEIAARLRGQVAAYSAGTLDAAQLRERMAGPAAGASLPELARAHEAARLAYLGGDYERSAGMLRSVADELERLPDGADVFALWTRTMLRLARTEVDLGRLDAARASIERLLRAAPDLAVDRSLTPGRLAEEIERARAALRAEPSGTLEISCSVPGARVYVNGRDVGVAPVRLVLPRGRYRVSGAWERAKLGRTVAEVGGEGREILLDLAVAEALRPALGPGLALEGGERARQLVAVGRHLGLERILGIGLAEEGGVSYVAGAIYDVRRGALEREGRVRLAAGVLPADASAALAEFLVTGRAPSGVVEVPGAAPAAALLPVLPPALGPPPARALAPRSRVALGLRIGFAPGQGDVASHTGMAEWVKSQVPVQADLLFPVSARLSLGAYGSWGFGRSGGDLRASCEAPRASCFLNVLRVGAQAVYTFSPGAVTPWVGGGLGYEWSFVHREDGSGSGAADVTARGLELANLQAGLDWALAPRLSAGPFVMMTLGRYDRLEADGSAVALEGEAAQVHLWSQLGLRVRLDL